MPSHPPNTAIYIKNLNDKVKKDELRSQLYSLFTPYGKVIDVVARKGAKMKGQAFVVFSDLSGATSALRALDGEFFYEKPMHIDYAKTKSHATVRLEDGPDAVPFVSKTASGVNGAVNGKLVVSRAEGEAEDREREKMAEQDVADLKRQRTDGGEEDGRPSKKARADDEDDVDMEMEDGD